MRRGKRQKLISDEIVDMIRKHRNGFTLIEVLIAVAISGIVVLGLARLYTAGLWSYNLQEQITDMHQNAHYTIKRLTEEMMQAGVDLPEKKLNVITRNPGDNDSVSLLVNPRAGSYTFSANYNTTNQFIQLDDASGFAGADSVIKWKKSDSTTAFLRINTSYNTGNFVKGVNVASTPDSIKLTADATFLSGDIIYPCFTRRYYRNGMNLCLNTNTNILAENIDSLGIWFYDKNKSATNNWDNILFGRIFVRARTSLPDKGYRHPTFNDGYRRVALSMDFRLRNKF